MYALLCLISFLQLTTSLAKIKKIFHENYQPKTNMIAKFLKKNLLLESFNFKSFKFSRLVTIPDVAKLNAGNSANNLFLFKCAWICGWADFYFQLSSDLMDCRLIIRGFKLSGLLIDCCHIYDKQLYISAYVISTAQNTALF